MSKKKTIKCPILNMTACFTNCAWWLEEYQCCAMARIGKVLSDAESVFETIHILADKDMSKNLLGNLKFLNEEGATKWAPLDDEEEDEAAADQPAACFSCHAPGLSSFSSARRCAYRP